MTDPDLPTAPQGAPSRKRFSLAGISFSSHITQFTSILAVLISVSSFLISINTNQSQEIRALRDRLTDTLDRFLVKQIEVLNLGAPPGGLFDQNAMQAYQQIVNTQSQQAISLLMQSASIASALSQRAPLEVNSTDYTTIAVGMAQLGNFPLAEEYYQRAAQAADNAFTRLDAEGAYGVFLFSQLGRGDEGRARFSALADDIRALDTDEGIVQSRLAGLYQMWSGAEANIGEFERAFDLITQACDATRGIQNNVLRANLINQVNTMLVQVGRFAAAFSQTQPAQTPPRCP